MLQQQFGQVKGAANGNAGTLSEWLIAQGNISRFQAKVLLSGQPGPFVFGDYRVYDRIEAGRLAGIFRAVHIPTNHPVLLQFLTGPYAQDVERLAKAAKRASISNGVHHPHIVRCYHFSDQRAYKFLVMDNLYGQSMDEMLAAKGPLPPSEACRVVRQAALGLMRMEELKMAHGEIRPPNLWMNHLGTVKLMEFPLWRDPLSDEMPFDAGAANDPKSSMAAQADYLAPELARGGGKTNVRSDIYSLGCVLYHLLPGQVPFPESNAFRKVLRHATEPVEPPDRLNSNVPAAVSQLVMYMMAKDPNQRYQQASHVAEALVPYIDPNGLTMFADPPNVSGQAYEAWLAQHHPAVQPDPGTGEFNFGVQQADFNKIDASGGAKLSAMPAFGGLGQVSAVPGVGGGFQAGVAPQMAPQGFPGGQGFPNQQGYASVQPQGFPTVSQSFPAMGPSAGQFPSVVAGATSSSPVSTRMSEAERERLAEERAERKFKNIAISVGSTIVICLVLLIIVIRLNSNAEDEIGPELANTPNTTTPNTTPTAMPVINPDDLEIGNKRTVGPQFTGDPNKAPNKTPSTTPNATPTNNPPVQVATVSADSVWGEIYEKGPLWASPTDGPPLNLKHMVSGVHIIVSFRPAGLLSNSEGKKILDQHTLGPFIRFVRSQLETTSGIKLEDMDQVVVGLMDNAGAAPKMALVVRTISPINESELLAKWGKPAETVVMNNKVYRGSQYMYHFPPSGTGRLMAMCPMSTDSVAQEDFLTRLTGQELPILRPDLEAVLAKSDDRRHFNMAFAPNFLFSGGKDIFNNEAMKLKSSVNDFMMVDLSANEIAKAGLLSFHLGDEYFYTELSINGGNAKPPTILARDLYETLAAVPRKVYDIYDPPSSAGSKLVPGEYSQPILARYPMMLSAWAAYLRANVDGKQVVLTSVLPTNAAHNLAMGTQLALVDKGTVTETKPVVVAAKKPLAEALQNRTTLQVPSDSFDRIIPLVEEELGYPIVFTPDLEKEGITKNKRFGIDEKNQTIEGILMAICREANPTGGVKDPASPDMKLVWVISPDQKQVLITIRSDAKSRGTAPAAFAIK